MIRRREISHLQEDLKTGEQKVLEMQKHLVGELDALLNHRSPDPKKVADLKEEVADIQLLLEHIQHEQSVEYVVQRRIPLRVKFALTGVFTLLLSGSGFYFYWTQLRQNISYGEAGGTVERFIPFTHSEALSDKLYFSGGQNAEHQIAFSSAHESHRIVGLFAGSDGTFRLFYTTGGESLQLMERTLSSSLAPIGDDRVITEDSTIREVAMDQSPSTGELYAFIQLENNLSRLIIIAPDGQITDQTTWAMDPSLEWHDAFVAVTDDRLFLGAHTRLPEKPTLLDVQHIVLHPFSLELRPHTERFEIDSQSYHLKTPCVLLDAAEQRYLLACGGRENVPPSDYIKGDELYGITLDREKFEPQEIVQLTYNKGHDFTLTDADQADDILFLAQNFTNNYPQTPEENFGFADGTGNVLFRAYHISDATVLGGTYQLTQYEPEYKRPTTGATRLFIVWQPNTNTVTSAYQIMNTEQTSIIVSSNSLIPNDNLLNTIRNKNTPQ